MDQIHRLILSEILRRIVEMVEDPDLTFRAGIAASI
jgi:hypothetical protein